MPLPQAEVGRGFSRKQGNIHTGSYRYGFNGMEKDNDIAEVNGSHLAFAFREYDTRLCRFFVVDPLSKKYPIYSGLGRLYLRLKDYPN